MISKIISKNMWNFLPKIKFFRVLLISTLLKLLVLPFSSHPFDFFVFVGASSRFSIYDYNVFDGWNKGIWLVLLWLSAHFLYLFSLEFINQSFSVLVLQFLFKLPYLFLDIIAGYLLYKISFAISKNQFLSDNVFYFWILSPIVFYVYGVHGHYDILVPFSLVLILYGLVFDKSFWSATGFVLSFSTKYFILLLIPAIILYLLVNHRLDFLKKFLGFSFILTVISYIHYIFYPSLVLQTLFSVVRQSSVDITFAEIKTIPSLNLFSGIYYLLYQNRLDSATGGIFYTLASNFIYIAFLGIILFYLFLIYKHLIKGQSLDFYLLIKYLTSVGFVILLSITNFQAHYLSWFLPALILLSVKNKFYTFALIVMNFASTIYTLRGEFGIRTFFLNISSDFNPNTLFNMDTEAKIYESLFILFSMVLYLILFLLIREKRGGDDIFTLKTPFLILNIFNTVLGFMVILVILQLVLTPNFFRQIPDSLVFGRNSFHSGYLGLTMSVSGFQNNTIYLNNRDSDNLAFSSIFGEEKYLDRFEAYIIPDYKYNPKKANFSKEEYEKSILKNANLNDKCKLTDFNYYKYLWANKDVAGFKLPITCFNKENNYLTLPQTDYKISLSDFKVLLQSKNLPTASFKAYSTVQNYKIVFSIAYILMILLLFVPIFKLANQNSKNAYF